jgi:hypothetical protein
MLMILILHAGTMPGTTVRLWRKHANSSSHHFGDFDTGTKGGQTLPSRPE